ncbi:DUF1648 domain-containing protein [Rudaeicoccus suwonensis]|uniref:Putative membrane protein n=1 Tax=Rudaeicoccus suwonensis TaxID=657409 RepID=A0A561EBG4_9MICO|nr:DUF1648 domain-containing protein [Rudaeicoccus suwonensis]TWE12956.1 putative membrane protein [Rudaeicoccus suwonensis]
MIWVNIAVVLLIAGCVYLSPQLSRPTVPLGVSVPARYAADPVVAIAIRRFHRITGSAGVVLLVAVVAIPNPAVGLAVGTLGMVAAGALALIWCRRSIIMTKRESHWYDDVSVVASASVSPQAHATPRRVWWSIGVALLVQAVAAAVGVARWSQLPQRFPVHFGISGRADSWADKSVMTVFGPLLIGLVVTVVLGVLLVILAKLPPRRYADGDQGGAKQRAESTLRVTTTILSGAVVLVATMFAVVGTTTYLTVPDELRGVVVIAMTVVMLAFAGFAVVRATRLRGEHQVVVTSESSTKSGTSAADSPDDDRVWKGGLVYFNRDDPAVFVPKRVGVGYTVNVGAPAGMALTIALLAFVVLGVVLPLALH